MNMLKIVVKVECDAAYRGEESPQPFCLREKPIEFSEIIDCWLSA